MTEIDYVERALRLSPFYIHRQNKADGSTIFTISTSKNGKAYRLPWTITRSQLNLALNPREILIQNAERKINEMKQLVADPPVANQIWFTTDPREQLCTWGYDKGGFIFVRTPNGPATAFVAIIESCWAISFTSTTINSKTRWEADENWPGYKWTLCPNN